MTVREIRTPDGRQLRLYDTGDPKGPLVIAHHGTPGCGMIWDEWAAGAVERGIRLVGFDRPGYDGSDRRPGRTVADIAVECATIADDCGADRFRTWGASGGGPHALACAAMLPDRVIAVATLASVAPYDAAGLDWLGGMGEDNVDEFGAAVAGEATLTEFLDVARPMLLGAGSEAVVDSMRSLLPPVDVAVLTGEMGSTLYEWMARGIRTGIDGWLDDDLAFVNSWGFDVASIAVPALVVQGRQDKMVPFAHGEWLAAHMPTAKAELSEDDGHVTLIARVGDIHDWLLRQG
jgi:pimeloyl-ACP methyl ester carboxylesterase